jgi:hypothetical protein
MGTPYKGWFESHGCPTAWLGGASSAGDSDSGGIGATLSILLHILAKRAGIRAAQAVPAFDFLSQVSRWAGLLFYRFQSKYWIL